ncbi:Fe-S cluster assembly protein SufD [Ligilactobacillus sp. WC1T17]|uniref:Fe-S cluster assembly protein SufD n=1 Tax=Ligilactobacillus ruminis TaxID=1623 RepID=A0ABY1AAQ2_9LACO|nr:Fe-S cluster assembly protein SufD [Ligilactobacillus ruminis]
MTLTKETIEAYSVFKKEPNFFTEKRLAAWIKADSLSLPSFQKIRYQKWPIQLQNDLKKEADTWPDDLLFTPSENQLVECGTTTVKCQLDEALTAQGVILTDLDDALKKHADLMETYFMTTAVKADENKLTAQHQALVSSGALLYIPKNTVIKEPITSYFIQNALQKKDYVHHVLIIADTNSEVSYLENLLTVGDVANTANIVVEVIAKAGSHVKFASFDRLGANTTTYLNRRGYLENDAKIDWSMGMMNDGNIVGDFDSDLKGAGSHAEVKVIAISTGKQVQGIDTRVTNYGKHSIGHILQHGVILAKSALIFNGIGHIIHGAKGADAQQESRVLMLSTKARGDANPILLIDDNDVSAGHAASVGRVDQSQLYYLMSRGLPQKIAERLVIRGFLGPVLTAVPNVTVRRQLSDMIEEKLVNGQADE